jgi:hypothetical protein
VACREVSYKWTLAGVDSLSNYCLCLCCGVCQSTQEIVRDEALCLLKTKLPDDQWKKLKLEMATEVEEEIKSYSDNNDLKPLQKEICLWMQDVFEADGTNIQYGVAKAVAAEAAEAVKTALNQASGAQPTFSEQDMELLEIAFTDEYVGDTHTSRSRSTCGGAGRSTSRWCTRRRTWRWCRALALARAGCCISSKPRRETPAPG